MISLEALIRMLRLVGLLLLMPGLWYLAGGLRVVVSGRIDERNRSAQSLKKGCAFLAIGIFVLIGAAWLNAWVK